VILRLAVSVEHRLFTDRQTDARTAYTALVWRRAVKQDSWRPGQDSDGRGTERPEKRDVPAKSGRVATLRTTQAPVAMLPTVLSIYDT